MANEIDESGINIETLAETIDAIINGTVDVPGLKDIYGDDISVDSDTPDGQLVNIYALAKQDILNLIVQSYNSKDPDQAVGVALDAVCELCGIFRREGTRTLVSVTVVTDRSLTLDGLDTSDTPYTVSDATGNEFELIATSNLTAGDNILAFQAKEIGSIEVLANIITVAVTIVLGVLSLNNPAAATTVGIDEETDAELRIRRQASIAVPSQGYLQNLLAGILTVVGVTSVQVIENDTSTGETARHTMTAVGTAQLDTAQKVFGTASLLLDGNSDSVTTPDSDDWHFGTEDFTIDRRVRFASLTGIQIIAGQYVDGTHYWFVQKDAAHKLHLKFVDGTAKGDYIMTSAWAGVAIDTWYHVEFARSGAEAFIFIDGISQTLTETTAFSTNDVGNLAAILTIGAQNSTGYFNGWMDEGRIVKGIAMHNSDFTPPTLPYSGSGKTRLLLHYDGIDTSTTILDTSDGQPAHSIWVIVQGGTDAEVAEVIYNYRNAGCGMKGDTAVNITQADSSIFEIRFDRPVAQDLYIDMVLEAKNAGTIDTDYVKEQIVARYILGVNEVADSSAVCAIIADIDENLVASEITVSDDGAVDVALLETSAEDKYFSNDTSRITIT
ncbi:MAG: baseplate J/gp47 family protein [Deltaproteobacteria bacterium]|nr:baseplate J/gp47 family protein [Deltaproteobacteria bacterium]